MKNGVDKADLEKGIKLPCILIENKVDLLKEDNEKDSNELEEFSKKNGFDGCFRTSAKTGKNINEALNYLICDIIKRRDNIKLNKDNLTKIEKESKNIPLKMNQNHKGENQINKKIKESNDDTKKCSFKEHVDKEATYYCYKCKVYLCDECNDYHEGLFENHKIYSLDEIDNEAFTGLCKENNHNIKLEYYCKTHNKLCCGLCICKIKGNGNGEHNDCDIYLIKDIKEEKKCKIKDNIKELEKFSDELEESIKNIKVNPEEVKENKDKLKSEIKNIFEKIRTELNNRENILISEIDKYFDDNYYNEGIVKKSDDIKSLLENVESINNDDWEDDDKLNELIYNCINIENNVKDINIIKAKIEKYIKNENKFNVKFNNDIDNIIIKIKKFGYILDSIILKEQNIINKFNKLINDDKITNNMNLLYRSSRDGFNYLNIINSINNKSNLLFLYLTENDRIFGAYIKTKLENININGPKKYYKDENAFVFSINNNKKYKILIPEYAIFFDNKNYILIGNNNGNNGFYFLDDVDDVVVDKQLIKGEKIYDFSKNSELTEDSGGLPY